MLKIYKATNVCGTIKITDEIYFSCDKYNTGYYGFGCIEKEKGVWCNPANYEVISLDNFEKYIKTIKINNGVVEKFILQNPKNYNMIYEKSKRVEKTEEEYQKNCLNEEAIILLTDMVYLKYKNDDLVKKILGKDDGVGLYLLKPNAIVNMSVSNFGSKKGENYEVLQSKSLGKRLLLTKFDRKIY